MSVTKIGDWFSIDCLWCGDKGLLECRVIMAGDHPANQSEAKGIVPCPKCKRDTRFVKMPGQPPILIPGRPSDWKKE